MDNLKNKPEGKRPTDAQAEEAVKTLISWLGEDSTRNGLIDTPSRVINAYKELFSGYAKQQELEQKDAKRSFDMENYEDFVLVRDIDFLSHCEHHMLPFWGRAHIAYFVKAKKVIGLSKLARITDIVSRKLQTQERITAELHEAISQAIDNDGVAVLLQCHHFCMHARGVKQINSSTISRHFSGKFCEINLQNQFLMLLGMGGFSNFDGKDASKDF